MDFLNTVTDGLQISLTLSGLFCSLPIMNPFQWDFDALKLWVCSYWPENVWFVCNLHWTELIIFDSYDPLCLQVRESTTGQFDISLKYNHTVYCGYVVYKPNSEVGHSGSDNASFCVTLPGE